MAREKARLSPAQLQEYARIGAAIRYQRLGEEVRAIERSFPDLASAKSHALHVVHGSRRAYRMSDEARKAVSQRMTKFWAERRRAASKTKGK